MSHTPHTRRGFLHALAAGALGGPALARIEGLERDFAASLPGATLGSGSAAEVRRLRDQYLLADDLVYLNHASIGTVPRPVHFAHIGYLELCESHPSLYVWGRVWREVTEETRAAAALLLGCGPDDLAVTHNTTEGFNILAHGLPLGPGDEVLFSSLNHPGASVAWEALAARRGFRVRRFDFPVGRGAELTAAEVVALHVEEIGPATRVLVFPHVDNMIGVRHPMAELAAAARAAGVAFVVVDGAQSAGMVPVSLGDSGVDAYAMSPHKWLQAPKGIGLFYVAASVRDRLERMWHRTPEAALDGSARRYEDYSTRAWPAVVALGDALAFQASLGEAEKERRHRATRERLFTRVEAEPGLLWRSPRGWRDGSAIVSIEVVGRDAPELGSGLIERHGVNLRAFGGPLNALRVSPHVMTTDDEIDRFLDILTEAAR